MIGQLKKVLISFLLMSIPTYAVTIKLGVLAPEGTNWANTLKDLSQEIKKETNGEVKFKIYFGGVQGDEPDVLRKTHLGTMHGGVFTGRTLGEIYGDVRVIELPFNFREKREKALQAVAALQTQFDKGFMDHGFQCLGYFEIGNVYLVSSKKVNNISDLKKIKIWSWEGDLLATSLVDSLELASVPLALPQVMSSLSTGVIDAAYATPLAIIALQWHSKVKFLVNFPITFSLGALVISNQGWNQIPSKYHQKIKAITKKYVDMANLQTIKENDDALIALKKNGIEFIDFPKTDVAKGKDIRSKVIVQLQTKKLITAKMVKLFDQHSNSK